MDVGGHGDPGSAVVVGQTRVTDLDADQGDRAVDAQHRRRRLDRTDTGLSCGGPSFVFEQDGINEYEDDKEFTITLTDNVDGACGQPVGEPLVLKLTKI